MQYVHFEVSLSSVMFLLGSLEVREFKAPPFIKWCAFPWVFNPVRPAVYSKQCRKQHVFALRSFKIIKRECRMFFVGACFFFLQIYRQVVVVVIGHLGGDIDAK